jgi:UDP-2-acetamido-3-amino-2,3-dideoxy-glucuronate N-acetyltransferase
MPIHELAKIGKNCTIYHSNLSNIGNCIIGDNCTIHAQVWIGDGVRIGNNVKIQGQAFIPSGVTIEDGAFIGPAVVFTNDKKLAGGEEWMTETKVCRWAKIGANATIIAGVTIGEGSKIGAGAVVTKNVPALEVWVGSPARNIEELKSVKRSCWITHPAGCCEDQPMPRDIN